MAFTEDDYRGDEDRLIHSHLRRRLFIIVFGTNTVAGKLFDIVLLWLIGISILAVMLESVSSIQLRFGHILRFVEWVITISFTIEYIIRLWIVKKPAKYIFSWLG